MFINTFNSFEFYVDPSFSFLELFILPQVLDRKETSKEITSDGDSFDHFASGDSRLEKNHS